MVNLCFFFFLLSSLNCITSNKNEKGHSSYIFTITYVYNTWNEYGRASTAQGWVRFKSHEKDHVSKEKQTEPKQNKKRGLKALVPHCVGIPHIPSWLFFFLFPVSQQTKIFVLVYAELFHSWLKFTFGHRSYSACWIQGENALNPKSWFNTLPPPTPIPHQNKDHKWIKKKNQGIGKSEKQKGIGRLNQNQLCYWVDWQLSKH